MCSILLVFEKNSSNDPEAAQNSRKFYDDLEILTSRNKAVELLGENTLLIKLNDNSSLYMLHKVLSLAEQHKQPAYKHAILPIEIEWYDISTYLKNKVSLNAAF